MPLIEIKQGQPYLSVKIVAPGMQGGQLVDWQHLRLVIMPPPEPRCELPLSPQRFTGFWPGHDVERWNRSFILPEEMPMVVYPAFGINDKAEVVFRLDSKIERLRGRYLGRVETTDGHPIVDLDLDVGLYQWITAGVSATDADCGSEMS